MFLTDRSAAEALPALQSLGLDVKTEHLAPESLTHSADIGADVLVVDAEANPDQAYRLLGLLASGGVPVPTVVVLARPDVERFAWGQVADDFVHSGTPAGELRVRLAMLARRIGGAGD